MKVKTCNILPVSLLIVAVASLVLAGNVLAKPAPGPNCVQYPLEPGTQFGVAWTDPAQPKVCGLEIHLTGSRPNRTTYIPAGREVAGRLYRVRWAGTQIVWVKQLCKNNVCVIDRATLWIEQR